MHYRNYPESRISLIFLYPAKWTAHLRILEGLPKPFDSYSLRELLFYQLHPHTRVKAQRIRSQSSLLWTSGGWGTWALGWAFFLLTWLLLPNSVGTFHPWREYPRSGERCTPLLTFVRNTAKVLHSGLSPLPTLTRAHTHRAFRVSYQYLVKLWNFPV